jgi:hypothetical protein
MAKSGYIENEKLPVKLAVLEITCMPTCVTWAHKKTPATTGRGLKESLVERAAARGTDSDGGVDLAGAYVKFASKDVGISARTCFRLPPSKEPEKFAEKLAVGDKSYDLYLRSSANTSPTRSHSRMSARMII